MTKLCRFCQIEKEEIDFSVRLNGKLRNECKECINKKAKERRKQNPEKEKAARRRWLENNREKHNAKNKKWRKNNMHKKRAQENAYYKNNPHQLEKKKAYRKEWRKLNSERDYQAKKRWGDKKRKTDLHYKMRHLLRGRFSNAFRKYIKNGYVKEKSVFQLLGCSLESLKSYLEKLFQPGMTWKNWSLKGWHIDHIKPLASFDLTNDEEARVAFHYTNLQPLWAKENLAKRDKIVK